MKAKKQDNKQLDSLSIKKIEAMIISAFESEPLTPKERKKKVEDLLKYRRERLFKEFKWTPKNIKAIEKVNEMLISESLAAAEHLRDHVDTLERIKPEAEIKDTDFEAQVEILEFHSEPTESDKAYPEYYETTHIEDVLVGDANTWYAEHKVNDLCYSIDEWAKSVNFNGLEKGWVLWLDENKETDNWNDGLPEEPTKDLHLCYSFYNLLENCHFAPQDIINIKKLHHTLIIRT